VLAEAPAPGLFDPKEQAAASAGELLDDEWMPLCADAPRPARVGGKLFRMHHQHFGRRLGTITLRPPEDFCQVVPNRRVVCLVRMEAEDRVEAANRRQLRSEASRMIASGRRRQ